MDRKNKYKGHIFGIAMSRDLDETIASTEIPEPIPCYQVYADTKQDLIDKLAKYFDTDSASFLDNYYDDGFYEDGEFS